MIPGVYQVYRCMSDQIFVVDATENSKQRQGVVARSAQRPDLVLNASNCNNDNHRNSRSIAV